MLVMDNIYWVQYLQYARSGALIDYLTVHTAAVGYTLAVPILYTGTLKLSLRLSSLKAVASYQGNLSAEHMLLPIKLHNKFPPECQKHYY